MSASEALEINLFLMSASEALEIWPVFTHGSTKLTRSPHD